MKVVGYDVCSGDNDPSYNLKFIISFALKSKDVNFILYLKQEYLTADIKLPVNVKCEICKDYISPSMGVLESMRLSDSTMMRMLKDLNLNKIDIAISAGSSGPLMFLSNKLISKVNETIKPAFAITYHPVDLSQYVIYLDSGASIDVTPDDFINWAQEAKKIQKISFNANAKIGLLNIGSEPSKGDALRKESYKLLQETFANEFIGNVEPTEVFGSKANIVLTDAFSGNLVIKAVEGTMNYLVGDTIKEYKKTLLGKIKLLMAKPLLMEVKKRIYNVNQGAAIIMGLSKKVVKLHGSAKEIDLENGLNFSLKLLA